MAASQGMFSEEVANLVEKVQGDAYYLKEVPKGLDGGEPMPPLSVVRLVCVASGMLVGIGFSAGKERSEAYRMALLSMALPKTEFCRLFGVTISPEDWPSQGLPACIKFDRGPGAVADLIKEFEHQIPIRELAPSYSGQSKANVESTHPRDVKIEGAPTYVQSDLTYIQMARREIKRLIKDNQHHSMEARMTPDMVRAEVFPTPLGVWNYLSSRRRTCQHAIPFDVAIRTLASPLKFNLHEDGVYLHEQRFGSDELRQTGIHDRAVKKVDTTIAGYGLTFTLRQVWVEVGRRLIAVEPMLPIRDDEGQKFVSLSDLLNLSALRAKARSKMRSHRLAAEAEARQTFSDASGHDWDAGKRNPGRPKRGSAKARQEFAETKKMFSK